MDDNDDMIYKQLFSDSQFHFRSSRNCVLQQREAMVDALEFEIPIDVAFDAVPQRMQCKNYQLTDSKAY